ncbi:unnamed protein product [Caenorhabditis nigoni]
MEQAYQNNLHQQHQQQRAPQQRPTGPQGLQGPSGLQGPPGLQPRSQIDQVFQILPVLRRRTHPVPQIAHFGVQTSRNYQKANISSNNSRYSIWIQQKSVHFSSRDPRIDSFGDEILELGYVIF